MTLDDALARLKSLRNEGTWALNEKNGAAGQQFGVKHGDIRTLAKEIKSDHALGPAALGHRKHRRPLPRHPDPETQIPDPG